MQRRRLTDLLPGRSRPVRLDSLSLTAAVIAALLIAGLALVVFGATWRATHTRPDESPAVAAATEAPPSSEPPSPTPAQNPPAASEGVPPAALPAVTGRPSLRWSEMSPSELATRLAEQPAGRWGEPVQRFLDRGLASATRLPVARSILPSVPASALGFSWPLRGWITSTFNDEHPLGIDIAPADGAAFVLAARDGWVVGAGGDPCCGYGYYVILDHGDGLTSIYGHFEEPPSVQAGERVVRGTVLGVAGNSGHSYGVHLHFEVRVNGVPVDPEAVLTAGHLNPLPIRVENRPTATARAAATEATPAPSDRGQAEIDQPAAVDERAAVSPSPEPAAQALATPPPSAPPTPSAPTPTPGGPTPSPTSPPVPQASVPAPSPPPTSTAAGGHADVAGASPSPSLSPTATATATPIASATVASPVPSSTPATTAPPAPAAASPSAAPVPACTAVTFQPGDQRRQLSLTPGGADQASVTIEVEAGGVRSLLAERCTAVGSLTVTAVPAEEHRCGAAVHDAAGQHLLRLIPVLAGVGNSTGETRWTVPAEVVRAGITVRLTCAPVATAERE